VDGLLTYPDHPTDLALRRHRRAIAGSDYPQVNGVELAMDDKIAQGLPRPFRVLRDMARMIVIQVDAPGASEHRIVFKLDYFFHIKTDRRRLDLCDHMRGLCRRMLFQQQYRHRRVFL